MKKLSLLVAVIATLLFTACTQEANQPQASQAKMKKSAKKMANFKAVPFAKAQILQKGEGKMYCPVCGMTLPMHYKTNHAAKHNGKDLQYCSIHCAAEDKEVNGKNLTNFKAVDNETLKFKDSKDMFFVVGSNKPGTMSPVSKYGFGTKAAAQDFASQFGGEVMSFEKTYAVAKKRLQADIEGTKKKQAKMAKMGKKILAKMCKPTQERFDNPAAAKTYLEKSQICGKLKGKKLQAVGLYLSGR